MTKTSLISTTICALVSERELFRNPERVATDKQVLSDPRRYDVPVTVIGCELPSTMLREWIEQDHPYAAELAKIRSVELVDVPTGQWPQFTRPAELAKAILSAVDR